MFQFNQKKNILSLGKENNKQVNSKKVDKKGKK